jgi:NAD(P)-dependent dehydrogenase (short-subunit alcohol dehydrogenase family)
MRDWSGVAGKRVIVTGATSGSCLTAARQLASLGAERPVLASSRQRREQWPR